MTPKQGIPVFGIPSQKNDANSLQDSWIILSSQLNEHGSCEVYTNKQLLRLSTTYYALRISCRLNQKINRLTSFGYLHYYPDNH